MRFSPISPDMFFTFNYFFFFPKSFAAFIFVSTHFLPLLFDIMMLNLGVGHGDCSVTVPIELGSYFRSYIGICLCTVHKRHLNVQINSFSQILILGS